MELVFKRYFTDPTRADLGVKKTFAEGVVTNYELVLQSAAGRKATVSFNASIFRSGDGQLQGIFASARDISEQARLQTQLSEQQAYNRSLIEASPDALFAIAPDGIITDVNEEATRMTGYSRKQLMNSTFSTYYTEPERAREGVKKTLAERRVIGYELTLITRYGRTNYRFVQRGCVHRCRRRAARHSRCGSRHHRRRRSWKASCEIRSSTRAL